MGRIQVGVELGGVATVTVPAFCVPEAWAGTLPNSPCRPTPDEFVEPPLWLLLLQAASAVMLATARASPPMVFLIIGPPSSRYPRLRSVLGSSACRPSLGVKAG